MLLLLSHKLIHVARKDGGLTEALKKKYIERDREIQRERRRGGREEGGSNFSMC